MATGRKALVKGRKDSGSGRDTAVLEAIAEAADPHTPPTEDEILSLILGELTGAAERRGEISDTRKP